MKMDGKPSNVKELGSNRAKLLPIMAIFAALAFFTLFLQTSVATAAPLDKKTPMTWLVLGDSLSAEYGLKRGTGWVALLESKLNQEKQDVQVFNASISGETTSGGKSRLPNLLAKHRPNLVIIELGGNDALRGLDMALTQENLRTMIADSKKMGANVLLIGMQLPPNFGKQYAAKFEGIFKSLAQDGASGVTKVTLAPFFLDGFGEDLSFFQADRIHPTEAAQPKMLANVWPMLKKQLPVK
jgi:acyl-CoA thioesterase I